MAFAIILGVLSIGVAYVASYLHAKHNFKVFSVLTFICSIICVYVSIWYASETTVINMRNAFQTVLTNLDTEEKVEVVEKIPEFYYAEAEILQQEELDDGTYKIMFIVGSTDMRIETFKSDIECPNGVPYLLTMSSKGTKNLTDDEIVVVWKDMH